MSSGQAGMNNERSLVVVFLGEGGKGVGNSGKAALTGGGEWELAPAEGHTRQS